MESDPVIGVAAGTPRVLPLTGGCRISQLLPKVFVDAAEVGNEPDDAFGLCGC